MLLRKKSGLTKKKLDKLIEKNAVKTATFAGGCFWCVEADFMKFPGIISVISGYAGSKENDPNYEKVSSGKTEFRESVQVYFDPEKLSYKELVTYFWHHINPFDSGGQFVDRGKQYRSAIFYHNEDQRKIAEKTKKQIEKSEKFSEPIVTDIIKFTGFYPAEEYHQNYANKNPQRYELYREGSGRDNFIRETWSNNPNNSKEKYQDPSTEELKNKLTPLQYHVTKEAGTERPFANEYWNNKKEGIYVDIISGQPLFSSLDKYDSGTGWPSFTKPIFNENLTSHSDIKLGTERMEIRSSLSGGHLGHVFNDGLPEKGGKRFCINSASLKFIPKEEMEESGYSDLLNIFENKNK